MKREEIIEGLKLLEDNMVYFDELQNDKGEWIDVHELLFEVIQTLNQEPTYYPPCQDCNKKMDEVRRIYDKIKEQESCNNAINCSDMLDAIGHGTTYTSEELQRIIQNLPPVNSKPCGDAISREAVLNILVPYRLEESKIAEEVKSLPSVTPSRRKGHWNEYYTSQKGNDVFNCKECGHTFIVMQGQDDMNFCPNCGAEMVEPQESEDKE